MEVESLNDLSVEKLRINIDENWNIERLSKILNSLNILYCITIIISLHEKEFSILTGYSNNYELAKAFLKNYVIINDTTYRKENDQFLKYFYGIDSRSSLAQNLLIKSISYNSPGNIDFLGIGKGIEILSNLLQYYFPNEKDKIILQQEKQKLFDMRIDSMRKLNLSPEEIKKILILENNSKRMMDRVVEENLISSIELLDDDEL